MEQNSLLSLLGNLTGLNKSSEQENKTDTDNFKKKKFGKRSSVLDAIQQQEFQKNKKTKQQKNQIPQKQEGKKQIQEITELEVVSPQSQKVPQQAQKIPVNSLLPEVSQVLAKQQVLPNKSIPVANVKDLITLENIAQQKGGSIQQKNDVPTQTTYSPIISTGENITIPEPLQAALNTAIVNDIKVIKEMKSKKEKLTTKTPIPEKKDTPEENKLYDAEVQEVRQAYQELSDKSLPENIDIVEIKQEFLDAKEEIGDLTADITEMDIKPILKKKDKSGYFKSTVKLPVDKFPSIMCDIAAYIKQQSKGIIKPRIVDVRVIANTNKTQLRGKAFKLSAATIVFKPDHNRLKVPKYSRIMISVPDDFESTGNLLVYMQESRGKTIIEIKHSEFKNDHQFIEFIGDRIAEYYTLGFDAAVAKFQLHSKNNPLIDILTKVLKSGGYKGKPLSDETHVYGIDFVSKIDNNQWLTVRVMESDLEGKYEVSGFNVVMGDEYQLLNRQVTYQWLLENILNTLDSAYQKDWSDEIKTDDSEEQFMYLLAKLKHTKLKNALLEIHNVETDSPNLGIEILKTASRKDMEKILSEDYDSEAIFGKTKQLKIFVLTYYAHQIIGGDSRHGSDFITRQQYYEKYSVKDRGDYQKRKRTVLAKGQESRNYNARPYIFQLEYETVNNKKHLFRAKSFIEIVNETGLFSNNIKFPKNTL